MKYDIKLPKGVHLIIDPEFEALIPPLSDDEFKQLRENIIETGECRDPIVAWYQMGTQGDYILLDGHNRWKVIQEFINTDSPISFHFASETLDSREEAKAWMIRNQLGRRNLPNYERARLALQLKPLLAEEAEKRQKEAGGDRRSEEYKESLLQKSVEAVEQRKPINVQKELAKAAGVSHDTIHKVEVIEEKATPEVKEQLRKGEVSINKAYNEIRQAERKTDGKIDNTYIVAQEFAQKWGLNMPQVEADDLEPEHIDKCAAMARINNAWENKSVESLIVEIDEHTRLMTDATWCDVAYSTELYKTDSEKEMVASALDDSLKRITALLGGLSRRIRESKNEQAL